MSTPRHPVFKAPDWLDREDEVLAPYAMRTRQSRGRRHPAEPHSFRTLFQRDRDRIIHSTAFRRLMYKTQVLTTTSSDHHRTRLTHTLEVAQISRTIARQLGLNEDLTEAIALAHDLGHPPFGHAGEAALDECMREEGGFEHNLHGLRIVDLLEYRYAEHPGLNLTWEVLESLALHSKRRSAPEIREFAAVGQPLLEAQVVDVTDSLAYDAHDVDDALSVGLVDVEDLERVAFCRQAAERVHRRHGALGASQFQPALVRELIDWQVADVLESSIQRLRLHQVRSVDEVRRAGEYLITAGPEVRFLKHELEQFLHQHVYSHCRVVRKAAKGQRFLKTMFQEFAQNPGLLPERYAQRARAGNLHRTICDYLAGMTDRYAQREFLRLFQPHHGV